MPDTTLQKAPSPPPLVALTEDEQARLDALWADNFGVQNRYEMPLKSSAGG